MELRSVFPILSVIGFYLLWVVMAQNGTIDALDLVSKIGEYPNGRPLKTSYVGIPVVDSSISTLVAFTDSLTGGGDVACRLVMIDVVSTLQTAGLWVIVESVRNGAGPLRIVLSSLWPLLWNGIGAGFILPIYYYVNLIGKNSHKKQVPRLKHAKAFLFTSIVALFLPAIFVLPPIEVPRSAEDNQTIAALFQITPLIAAVLQTVIPLFMASKPGAGRDEEKILLRRAYLFSAVFSATGHIYSLLTSIFSNDPAVTWYKVYFPSPSDVVPDSEWTIREGSLLFIKYDFIIINISSAIWLYLSLKPYLNMKTAFEKGSTMFLIILSTLAVGPGACVSWGLRLREDWIL
ncbi:hypothetical protein BGW36DRAFT_285720 [Talaromyces proteolyticus]|uniref:Uncharacterized protein n=1 Tax=Talaromyces proteolyticus TaxID=1131652 RepID=A0AAD4KZC4_9EURO|nr:uncharacterized protein BGW36DRAFT_285720 [Talaromyces proteolyticus]KAH8704703.1 hypothetical protein BGW36DRAFT_285720 [Talaromyces proteolyticus]